MKNSGAQILFSFCLFCILSLLLPHPARGEMKLGLVDILKTLNDSSIGLAAKTELSGFIESRQEIIDNAEKSIETLKLDIARTPEDSAFLRERKAEELESLIEEYQGKVSRLQNEIAEKQEELTRRVTERLKTLIEEIGLVEEYSLILDKDDDVVLYCDKALLLEIK